MVQKNMETRRVSGSEGNGQRLGFFRRMKEDIEAIREKDPAANNLNAFTILLTYPGLQALTLHRLIHRLYEKKWYNTARIMSHLVKMLTHIEIHPGAKIGRRVVIDHGIGVVIGETSEVGNDVLIYQGVTLGGTGKETGKRHPTIGNGVVIGAGAKVLGSKTIGDNCRIGAEALVVSDMPPNSTTVNLKSRIVPIGAEKIDLLAHDVLEERFGSVDSEVVQLRQKVEQLAKEVERLSGKSRE